MGAVNPMVPRFCECHIVAYVHSKLVASHKKLHFIVFTKIISIIATRILKARKKPSAQLCTDLLIDMLSSKSFPENVLDVFMKR